MNEKYSVVYSPEALEDLRSIYSYIAFELQAPMAAAKLVKRIRTEIYLLDEMPARFVLVDWEPWKSRNTHKMPVGKYIVYYIVYESELKVEIIRIFYGGRDIPRII